MSEGEGEWTLYYTQVISHINMLYLWPCMMRKHATKCICSYQPKFTRVWILFNTSWSTKKLSNSVSDFKSDYTTMHVQINAKKWKKTIDFEKLQLVARFLIGSHIYYHSFMKFKVTSEILGWSQEIHWVSVVSDWLVVD